MHFNRLFLLNSEKQVRIKINKLFEPFFFAAALDLIGRCRCHETMKFIKGNFSDFNVWEKHPGCDKTELT